MKHKTNINGIKLIISFFFQHIKNLIFNELSLTNNNSFLNLCTL